MIVAMCACNNGKVTDTTAAETTTAADETTAADTTAAETTAESTTAEETTEELITGDEGGFDEDLYVWEEEDAYPATPEGLNETTGFNASSLYEDKALGTVFTVDQGFVSAITVRCPSWNDNDGELKFALYEWVEDTEETKIKLKLEASYAKTIATEPIAEEVYTISDNSWNGLYFFDPETAPVEGKTYLFVVTAADPATEQYDVGVYTTKYGNDWRGIAHDSTEPFKEGNRISNVHAFKNNGEATRVDFMMCRIEVTVPVDEVITE
jgi:hypothetical protein